MLTLWLVAPSTAGAGEVPAAPTPRPWPATVDLAPSLDTTAHSLRISGPDRYQTNLALALTLRGRGDAPYDTPDRTSGGAATVAEADDWWGPGTCPLAVIVVAGDSAADALAAASLSDPTDGSDEPRLVRVASASALFAVGEIGQPDTELAPVLLTGAARLGASGLTVAAQAAAADLSVGGCSARSAIIVGGTAAVPLKAEQDLLDAGIEQVFRVGGVDRYETAALMAEALGTGDPPDDRTCTAPTGEDAHMLRFHANAVVEVQDSASSCRLLPRTVVLADGITGADALAGGWWTSFFQVPVLLSGPDGTLPGNTRSALANIEIDNLVVLGGTGRIPEATMAEAAALATAEPFRIAGTDRFGTSVAMAERFAGWYPTGDGSDFAGEIVCVAGSAGEGPAATGWPDALAAGPWCAAAASTGAVAPVRALPPVTGPASLPVDSPTPGPPPADSAPLGYRAVPILLTPPGEADLAGPVTDLLERAFVPDASWCSGSDAPQGCLAPGFAVVFGGTGAVSDLAVQRAATLVSGQRYGDPGDVSPTAAGGFWTRLDLSPVFHLPLDPDQERVCYDRAALVDVRWLAVTTDARAGTLAGFDLLTAAGYQRDADGVARSAGQSAPVCVAWTDDGVAPEPPVADVAGVSLSGHATAPLTVDPSAPQRLELSGVVRQVGAEERTGAPGASVEPGEVTRWVFDDDAVPAAPAVVSRGAGTGVGGANLDVTVTRGPDVDPAVPVDTFAATFELGTPMGTVVGEVSGEARFVEDRWELRGRTELTGGTWNVASGSGGFRATVDLNVAEDDGDDEVSWQLDGLVSGPG